MQKNILPWSSPRVWNRSQRQLQHLRNANHSSCPSSPSHAPLIPTGQHFSGGHAFGFLFDIDGVFLRGRTVIPEAKEALHYLLDRHQNWRVPVVFVTNAGNKPKWRKAEDLSTKLGIKVHADQVIMSHSPLQMLPHFHKQHVLLCGQGAVRQIAHELGFRDVTTLDELSAHYPQLDVCDHNRRRPPPCAFEPYNRRIDAVILLGEPTHWERSLQLLMDILVTNGQPYSDHQHTATVAMSTAQLFSSSPALTTLLQESLASPATPSVPYPHLPVIACNLDATWMSEAPLARLGHGAFLACVERVYEKLTGKRLLYTALLGKPSEMTYHYAESRLQMVAHQLRINGHPEQRPVKRIYCVGDNPHTDIYGANLYQRYLQSQSALRMLPPPTNLTSTKRASSPLTTSAHLQNSPSSSARHENRSLTTLANRPTSPTPTTEETRRPWELRTGVAEDCASVLVCTGVYQMKFDEVEAMRLSESPALLASFSGLGTLHHRDFPNNPELTRPHLVAKDVAAAVRMVFHRENCPCT